MEQKQFFASVIVAVVAFVLLNLIIPATATSQSVEKMPIHEEPDLGNSFVLEVERVYFDSSDDSARVDIKNALTGEEWWGGREVGDIIFIGDAEFLISEIDVESETVILSQRGDTFLTSSPDKLEIAEDDRFIATVYN